mgnify:CR=1 FL=1
MIVENTHSIDGKLVKILFNFDEYPLDFYRKEFRELLEYQYGREEQKIDEATGTPIARQYDLKRLRPAEISKLKNYGTYKLLTTRFPYAYFKENVVNVLTKLLVRILAQNPRIITSKSFQLNIKIIRVEGREFYGQYQNEVSDDSVAYLDFNGLWLLN